MKIIVIKLGAKGDVIRTLPIAEAIKKKYPSSELYWITKANIAQMLSGNSYINKICSLPFKTEEKFDILYNFDIEDEATSLAKSIKAEKKYGFYFEGGYPASFNPGAEYYLNTLFDDNLKKTNKKTYQAMMFEAADLPFNNEKPKIYLDEKDKKYAEDFVRENKINSANLIGIHMGSSPRWPSKAWPKNKIKEFIIKSNELGHEILLFGGPDELSKMKELVKELKDNKINFYQNNPHNSDKEFASLINICQRIVCSDSFALHVALALNKPTIGLFFCTAPNEVESYGLLKKVISPRLYDFFPEKQDQYDENLVNSISTEEVLSVINNNK